MNEKEFYDAINDLGIKITEQQKKSLQIYCEFLISENQKTNLTAIKEPAEIYLKHFYDSLTIAKVVDLSEIKTLCDIGTGAGFPGIVLKIFYPNLKITLIDSLQKRVNYLNEIIKDLGLDNIEAIHVRGEDYKGQYDVVTSRAVANIEKLLGYTMHLVSPTGIFVAMKGDIEKELTLDVKKKIEKKYKIEKIEKIIVL